MKGWICFHSYKESNIPRHPCFELVANSEQILNVRVSRRLLTMEKTRHYQVPVNFSYIITALIFYKCMFMQEAVGYDDGAMDVVCIVRFLLLCLHLLCCCVCTDKDLIKNRSTVLKARL